MLRPIYGNNPLILFVGTDFWVMYDCTFIKGFHMKSVGYRNVAIVTIFVCVSWSLSITTIRTSREI